MLNKLINLLLNVHYNVNDISIKAYELVKNFKIKKIKCKHCNHTTIIFHRKNVVKCFHCARETIQED